MTDLTDLLSAISRAEKSGLTDEENAKLLASMEFVRNLDDIIACWHKDNGGPLDSLDLLKTLAIYLAARIILQTDKSRPEGPAILTLYLTSLIIETVKGNSEK